MNTKHFNEYELECKCGCGTYLENVALMMALEDVRNHFNAPVTITSSTRCEKHNKKVGGSKNSWHLSGHAADIQVFNVSPRVVHSYLESCSYAGLIGLGKYNSFTHIDTRGYKARW